MAAEAHAKLALENPAAALRHELDQCDSAASMKDAISKAMKSVEGGPAQRMKILYSAFFEEMNGESSLAAAIKSKTSLLLPYAQDPAGQLAQLVAVEYLLTGAQSARLREAPIILKVLYDEDLADEALIMAWYNKADAASVLNVAAEDGKKVREASEKFINWLEEAESDEDDESDEE